jgi:hypothetical protein
MEACNVWNSPSSSSKSPSAWRHVICFFTFIVSFWINVGTNRPRVSYWNNCAWSMLSMNATQLLLQRMFPVRPVQHKWKTCHLLYILNIQCMRWTHHREVTSTHQHFLSPKIPMKFKCNLIPLPWKFNSDPCHSTITSTSHKAENFIKFLKNASFLFLVLTLCIAEFFWECSWLFTIKFINLNKYWHGSGKILKLMNRFLHEVLDLTSAIILTLLFCKVNIILVLGELPQKIIPLFHYGMEINK